MGLRSRLLLLVATAMIALIIVGRSYQVIAWNLDAKRAPEAGKLVDSGGRRPQLFCTGQGSTPVATLHSNSEQLCSEIPFPIMHTYARAGRKHAPCLHLAVST